MGRLDFSQRKIRDRQNRYISALIKPYVLQINALLDIIRKQQLLIDDLKAQLDTNSRNSSNPPSSGQKPNSPPKPSPKSLRGKSGKKRGGQKGHKGHGFSLPKSPPNTIVPCLPSECLQCPHSSECATNQKKIESRYVQDILLSLILIRYDAYSRRCPLRNGTKLSGTFPLNVNHTKQYGETFWMLAVSLYLFFNSSYQKVHEFLSCLTGKKTSAAWACNKVKTLAEGMSAREAVKKIKIRLLQESVVVCDETGARAEAKNAWVHTASTPGLTYQTASQSRGVRGMIEADFLPHFNGVIVHDCWTPYWSEQLTEPGKHEKCSGSLLHALCNQHLIRELRWIYEHGPGHEQGAQNWSFDLAAWLLTFNAYRKMAIANGRSSFTRETIENFTDVFWDCINEGRRCNPKSQDRKESRIFQKIHALFNRLEKRGKEFLRFLTDFSIPFTSNQAERDLRGHKPRFAVSGSFRTLAGLKRYVTLYSVGQTARKNNVSWSEVIMGLIRQQDPELIMGLIPQQ